MMAEPQKENDEILKEWTTLSRCLHQIPVTVRRGLFLDTVKLTTIDAVPEYLVVGTNIGVVYWYHRETHNMQRFHPEKQNYKITSIKLVSSVDYMLAAGDENGTVTVFRIPKPTPDWISPAYKQHSSSSIERYTVGGLHSSPVTALEWSTNGQKLFSGDATGLVVFTEIDFYMKLSKACEILNEKYQIVQLSFNQNSQALVVATEYRCIVAHRSSHNTWQVVQVGQKERRSLCKVGATFFPHPHSPLERIIFSSRPGWRFWQADSKGVVNKTLIFKEALRRPQQHIEILHSSVKRDTARDTDPGTVVAWRGRYLVTLSPTGLAVLDPQHTAVVASLSLPDLHALAVTSTEIFVIQGFHNIMRFSYIPDPYSGSTEESGLSMLENLNVSPVTDTIKDLTAILKSSAAYFVKNQPLSAVIGSVEGAGEVVTGTDALELDLPPVVPVDSGVHELKVQQDPRIEVLDQIGKQSFDEILHSSIKKVKISNIKQIKTNKYFIGIGTESSSDSYSVRSDTISVKSEESVQSQPNTSPPSRNNNELPEPTSQVHLSLDLVSSSNHLPGEIPPDILPDLRSPHSILKDVHDKEILVAKAFNLEDILLNITKEHEKEANTLKFPEVPLLKCEQKEESLIYGPPSGSSSAIPSLEGVNPSLCPDTNRSALKVNECNVKEDLNHPLVEDICPAVSTEEEHTDGNDRWVQVGTPEPAQYVSTCQNYTVISGPGRALYSRTLGQKHAMWQKLPYRALHLELSPGCKLVWKVDFGVAAALLNSSTEEPEGSEWEIAARGVESLALTDTCAWYVSAGKIYLQTDLSQNRPFQDSCVVPCPGPVLKISCSKDMVWVLTADYSVLWRAGITDQCVEGSHWQRVVTPSNLQVADIALGPYNLGWLIDRSNFIYFSDNYISEGCSWWQVLIRNYLFENSSLCQVTSNKSSVWVTNRISPFVYVNKTSLKGHYWIDTPINNLTVPLRWKQISAEGVFEDKGSLWLLSSGNDLFHLRPNSDSVNVIAFPCRAEDVSCISAAPHALWLLTHAGHIYVRQGMGDQCPEGDKWRTLNLEQISDKQVTLRHVSCGCDMIWACDTRGDIYMAVGSPYTIATDTFSPAWVQVEGKPLANTLFVKVFVGSETHIVWALDNKSNVYVRSGIFHDFQLGTDWVLVTGIQASVITISGSLVWALSTSGSVFCRCGITENNYIGNYWYQVPGSLYHLTASLSEELWGVSDKSGGLVTYSQHCVLLDEKARQSQALTAVVDDGWEVI